MLTFVDVNDVWVLNGRHDLDLSSDSDEVGLCLDLALLDRLDCHLAENSLEIDITEWVMRKLRHRVCVAMTVQSKRGRDPIP